MRREERGNSKEQRRRDDRSKDKRRALGDGGEAAKAERAVDIVYKKWPCEELLTHC